MSCTYRLCGSSPPDRDAVSTFCRALPGATRVDEKGYARILLHIGDCRHPARPFDFDIFVDTEYDAEVYGNFHRPHGHMDSFCCANELHELLDTHLNQSVFPPPPTRHSNMERFTCLRDPPQGALPLLPQTVLPPTNKHYTFNFVTCANMDPLPTQRMIREIGRAFPHAILGYGAGAAVRVHGACCCAYAHDVPMDLRVDLCWRGTFCDQSGTKHWFTSVEKMRQLVYESFLSAPPAAHTCSPPGDMAASSSSSSTRIDFATECALAAYGTAIALCEHGSKPALEAALRKLQSQLYAIDCAQLLAEMNKHNHTTARLGQNMKEPLCIFRGSVVAMTKYPSGRTLDANPPEIGRLFAL